MKIWPDRSVAGFDGTVRSARRRPRYWFYGRGEWGHWRPTFGSDEYGRKTLAIPLGFGCAFIWAFWTWTDTDANQMRQQTVEWALWEDEL